MLGAIRNKSKGWVAYLIVGLITIPFALFGINEYFTGSSNIVVATIDDDEISKDKFLSRFNPQKRRLQQELGAKYDANFDVILKQSVIEQMVNESLLNRLANNLSHVTTASELSAIIQSNDVFHDDGKFSLERYEQILRLNGFSKTQYESSRDSELTQSQVKYNLLDSAFITPSAFKRLTELNNQEREIKYLTLDAKDYISKVKVEDKSVKDYFDKQKSAFFEKPKAKIESVELSLEQVAKSINPSDDDLFNYYEEEKSRFGADEERQAAHILVADEATANKVVGLLNSGSDFSKLASEYSEDTGSKDNGGDLGYFSRGVMVLEFEDKAFSMNIGETSSVVKSEFGYHIIRLNNIKGGETKSFAQAKDEIKSLYTQSEAQKKLYDLNEQMANLAYEGSLEEVASQLGLEIKTSDFFDMSSKSHNTKIIAAAFSDPVYNKGENSEVIELGEDKYLVLRVKDKKSKRQKSFDEVKDEINTHLSTILSKTFIDKIAENISKALSSGDDKTAEDLMKKYNLKFSEKTWVDRGSSTVEDIVLSKIFAMPKPLDNKSVFYGASLNNTSSVVIELSGVKTSVDKTINQALANSIIDYETDEIFVSILKSQRDNSEIKIFKERL